MAQKTITEKERKENELSEKKKKNKFLEPTPDVVLPRSQPDFAKQCNMRNIPELPLERGPLPRKHIAVFAYKCETPEELREVLNAYHTFKKGINVRSSGFVDPYRIRLSYPRARLREQRKKALKSEAALKRKAERMQDPVYAEKMRLKVEQRKLRTQDPRVKESRKRSRQMQVLIARRVRAINPHISALVHEQGEQVIRDVVIDAVALE